MRIINFKDMISISEMIPVNASNEEIRFKKRLREMYRPPKVRPKSND